MIVQHYSENANGEKYFLYLIFYFEIFLPRENTLFMTYRGILTFIYAKKKKNRGQRTRERQHIHVVFECENPFSFTEICQRFRERTEYEIFFKQTNLTKVYVMLFGLRIIEF